MNTYTTEQRQEALRVVDAYFATCEQHESDLRYAAAHGCPQSQRDLPFIDRWNATYWDDVMFELQMRLHLDDDDVQALVETLAP